MFLFFLNKTFQKQRALYSIQDLPSLVNYKKHHCKISRGNIDSFLR